MVFSSDYGMFTAPWTVEFSDCYIANCENQAPNKPFMTFQQNVKVESTKVYSKTGGNIFNIRGTPLVNKKLDKTVMTFCSSIVKWSLSVIHSQ